MPFSAGAQGAGVKIEPLSTIRRYAPLCFWRMNEASGSLINSGSAASKDVTATNLTYAQPKIATRSPNTAITFNGTTTTTQVAAGVIGGTSPTFSVGCWVKFTSTAGVQTLIAQKDGTNGNSGFELRINSGYYIEFIGTTTSGLNEIALSSQQLNTLPDGNAHYVGVTVSATKCNIFVDGSQVGDWTRTGGVWSAIPKIFLGQSSGPTNRFNGTMSHAFITSQVLTQADHTRIWRNGMLNAVTPEGANFNDAIELAFPTTSTTLTAFDLGLCPIEPNEFGFYVGDGIYFPTANSTSSRWYKINAVAGKKLKFVGSAPGTGYHYIEAYKDTDGTMANLEYVKRSLGFVTNMTINPTEAATYYIRVRSYNLHATVLDLTYEYVTPPAPPANDAFADAITLDTTAAGSTTGTLLGSTVEFPLETDNWTGEPNSVWYKFVADATGNITFDTELSSPFNDMVLQIWENTTLAAIEAAPYDAPWYDNDTGPGGTVLVTVPVVSGRTYHIQASDYGTEGNFVLRWTDIV